MEMRPENMRVSPMYLPIHADKEVWMIMIMMQEM